MKLGPGRRNFLDTGQADRWRPPPFGPATRRRDRWRAAARRALDLQAASIWNDMHALLSEVDGAVLDVGAGAQPYRGLFAPSVRYRAIDSRLASAFGYDVPDTTYFDGEVWPVEDGSIDLVLATETLEHVPEPLGFLREAHRSLRDGGTILLTVPFAARWHYIPHDYWRFTPSSLCTLLEEAGFTGVKVYARGNELTVACAKTMALLLPVLFPQQGRRITWPFAAAIVVPGMVILAAIGQLSLRRAGSDDCLGWTVMADAAPAA